MEWGPPQGQGHQVGAGVQDQLGLTLGAKTPPWGSSLQSISRAQSVGKREDGTGGYKEEDRKNGTLAKRRRKTHVKPKGDQGSEPGTKKGQRKE